MSSNLYVIVKPGDRGHIGDDPQKYLVVNVEEWVRIYHEEQDHYNYVLEHDTLNAAHEDRNRLNGVSDHVEDPPLTEQPEVAVTTGGSGEVAWLGVKAS